MIIDLLLAFLGFLFRVFIEIICFYTGEIILFVFSLGVKKPRWNYYLDSSVPKFVVFTEISTWIGMAFWIVLIGFVARLLAN